MSGKTVVIIPARYQSTRLPGKPLIQLAGKLMIQWVYEKARTVRQADKVIVATDDQRILKAVTDFGGEAVMTPTHLATGSERVGMVAKNLDAEIIVNLQGDEPLISPTAVETAVDTLLNNTQIDVATLGFPLTSESDWKNPAIVKILLDEQMKAIYFSRAAIPFHRDEAFQPMPQLMRHIGVYIFRKSFLMQYLQWPPGQFEDREKLEQLRIIEKGYHIQVVAADKLSPGVDVPDDIKRIEKLLTKT